MKEIFYLIIFLVTRTASVHLVIVAAVVMPAGDVPAYGGHGQHRLVLIVEVLVDLEDLDPSLKILQC